MQFAFISHFCSNSMHILAPLELVTFAPELAGTHTHILSECAREVVEVIIPQLLRNIFYMSCFGSEPGLGYHHAVVAHKFLRGHPGFLTEQSAEVAVRQFGVFRHLMSWKFLRGILLYLFNQLGQPAMFGLCAWCCVHEPATYQYIYQRVGNHFNRATRIFI